MSAYKASGILNKVGRMKSYDLDSEIKIEYGNPLFHTAHLFVDDFEIHGTNLLIKLAITKTDCKAKETCGIPETVDALIDTSSCVPGSGCC